MTPIENKTQCKCHQCGCNIYTGKLAKYISDGKTYCVEHGRVKSLYNGFRVWLGRQIRDNMAQANTVQKKWMDTITEWALNGGLRLLYGDEWEFSQFDRHHVKGRTFKHNKVAIGHEFILPVPREIHDVHSNHNLNVTSRKYNFTNEFGMQSELFMKMYNDMNDQGYDVSCITTNVSMAIEDLNA